MEIKLNGTQMKILEEIKKKPCYREEISRNLKICYSFIYRETKVLLENKLITEEINFRDNRRKNLIISREGLIFIAKLEMRKSAIAKIDSWLDKKFNEIGIDCERLFG